MKPAKYNQVAEEIRLSIESGRYATGEKLPSERELARLYGVARPTLRLALSSLEDRGYVQSRIGSKGGWFVTNLRLPTAEWRQRMRDNVDDLDDMLDFRIALESQAAALAAERRSQSQLEEMAEALERIRRIGGDGQVTSSKATELRAADTAFHEVVARAARNTRLRDAVRASRAELFATQRRSVYEEIAPVLLSDHESIYRWIVARDSAKAAQAMVEHINHGRDRVRLWIMSSDPW